MTFKIKFEEGSCKSKLKILSLIETYLIYRYTLNRTTRYIILCILVFNRKNITYRNIPIHGNVGKMAAHDFVLSAVDCTVEFFYPPNKSSAGKKLDSGDCKG